jgi:virginiamycin B lyase
MLVLGGGMAITRSAAAIAPPGVIEEISVPLQSNYFGLEAIARGPEGTMLFTQYGDGIVGRLTLPTQITEYKVQADGRFGEAEEYFGQPEFTRRLEGITVDTDGNIWFTDHGVYNDEQSFIGRITPTGVFTKFVIRTEDKKGSYPGGIALGSDGNMWFTNPESNEDLGGDLITEMSAPERASIGRITPEGVISTFDLPSRDHLSSGIGSGEEGDLWFTGDVFTEKIGGEQTDPTGSSFVGRITSSGTITEFPLPVQDANPGSIALGFDGNMWFTESSAIGRITPSGTITEFPAPDVPPTVVPFRGGSQIVQGPDGNMWFTEESNSIGRITPAGEVVSFTPISAADRELSEIADGPDGEIWFTEAGSDYREGTGHIGRLILRPLNTAPPVVSGSAVAGQTLSVTAGLWSNAPDAFRYQWQLCNAFGAGCTNLNGTATATQPVTSDEVGYTLRAIVSAGNASGSTSAVSAPSAIVGAQAPVPHPPPPKPPVKGKKPLHVLDAKMTWSFGRTRTYTVVESLAVHGLPLGSTVQITCQGAGCTFAHRSLTMTAPSHSCHGRECMHKHPVRTQDELSLRKLFQGHRLQVGAKISVIMHDPGWIGKTFDFTMRADRSPRVRITCPTTKATGGASGC